MATPADPDMMRRFEKLPGTEIVLPGLEDVEASRESVNAAARAQTS